MVAVDHATATGLLRRPFSSDHKAMRMLAAALSRSLATEGIPGDLIDALEDALRVDPDPRPAPARKLDGLLHRLGLPLPRPRRPPRPALPLTQEETARITARFHRATGQLIHVVQWRTEVYPTEELRLLRLLRNEQPAQEESRAYLRRYALAILAILDLMGDDA
ncbi:hypothetical protein G3I19_00365 [Streptomyces sp. SID10853]|uniref:hypothetical protein n=1 Tax=Streptomyces sp. SID10853 TaxID=2706028 RepID=UPI0013C0C8A1|nr:hypothetical protein [Streptomyces sp. SID10853]NDZ76998.1 hypothetical protein [Streptomyces sp. SID10853]